jgi:hypothetical protein
MFLVFLVFYEFSKAKEHLKQDIPRFYFEHVLLTNTLIEY